MQVEVREKLNVQTLFISVIAKFDLVLIKKCNVRCHLVRKFHIRFCSVNEKASEI